MRIFDSEDVPAPHSFRSLSKPGNQKHNNMSKVTFGIQSSSSIGTKDDTQNPQMTTLVSTHYIMPGS